MTNNAYLNTAGIGASVGMNAYTLFSLGRTANRVVTLFTRFGAAFMGYTQAIQPPPEGISPPPSSPHSLAIISSGAAAPPQLPHYFYRLLEYIPYIFQQAAPDLSPAIISPESAPAQMSPFVTPTMINGSLQRVQTFTLPLVSTEIALYSPYAPTCLPHERPQDDPIFLIGAVALIALAAVALFAMVHSRSRATVENLRNRVSAAPTAESMAASVAAAPVRADGDGQPVATTEAPAPADPTPKAQPATPTAPTESVLGWLVSSISSIVDRLFRFLGLRA